MYYLRFAFATRPLKVLDSLRIGPYFALRALERIGTMQLGPGEWTAAVRPQFRRGLAGVRPGESRGGA
jgi:hypothetical protein